MIEIRHVHKTFLVGAAPFEALRDIDLSVKRGEIFGIIGHSGAGKSTLLRCINGLEKPSAGTVAVQGIVLSDCAPKRLQVERRKIGMIFQHFHLLSSATVFENIAFPMRLAKAPKAAVEARVRDLASLVGLESHLAYYPAQLSGGQKQRVGIARALANDPLVLLCDEATSALDPQTTDSILQLLLEINEKLGLTIVLITHEMHVIRAICDRVAVIDGGRIVECGDVVDVFLRPQHPTTRQFVRQGNGDGELASFRSAAGTMLRITFQGEQTYEPLLFDTVRATGMSFSILQGSISRMKRIPYGQLIVELHGAEEAARRTVDSLRGRGLDVEVMPC
ncbi:ATP-binding cassette domain-containing protein [Paenibacillus antri]|uniref:ATP-binding cassette domain-containing protein n=1 Tax=Paenibacillus antri TaxID=2582848 RepID=A0A5R9GC98_9BACL|nr:ATP-binding cassette domain-containing protein [Paenibacillus antri]TLS52709.1 ATP-binding cassette domain-containing protein [Paenibacillus antri]